MTETNGKHETPLRSRADKKIGPPRKRRRVIDDDESVPTTTTIVAEEPSKDEDFETCIDSLLGNNDTKPSDYLLKNVKDILQDKDALEMANVRRLWADSYESIETGRKSKEDDNVWMCGDVLDLFAYTLRCGREETVSHLCSQISTPFVFKDLIDEQNTSSENLRNQICCIGVSKYTFWPVLAEDEHWILITFEKSQDGKQDRVLLFDSLNRKKYFTDAQKKLDELRMLPYAPQWIQQLSLQNVTAVKDTKRHQHDGKNVDVHSCGAWVCLYMELLTRNVPVTFIVNYLNSISATEAKLGITSYEKLLQKRLIDFVVEDQIEEIRNKHQKDD